MSSVGYSPIVVALSAVLSQQIEQVPRLATSDIIDYARAIVHDSGYDASDAETYAFFINAPQDSLGSRIHHNSRPRA